ncbi:MAG: chitobiase/beta-hexosaminidase C-terminal domain-containing protein [Terracidiphilus sp.]
MALRSGAALLFLLAIALLAAAGAAQAQTCAGMALGNGASLNGFIPFPATNAWNTNISTAPLDPDSAAITSAAGFAGLHLHPDFGSESYYGIPYVVVDSTTTPAVPINVIDYPSESDVVVAPYPATAPIEGQPADCSGWPDAYNGDAHVLVLDRAKCFLYETWNTNRCNSQYNASSETIWDMSNSESRPWGWTSADAAGLPIFPGLVRYDEVASGAIHHAIRFTMVHTKDDANDGYFVPPATHAAGNIWGVSNVMGMRIRLKAGFDISSYSATNQVILTAMKQYGMILADNGGYFFFQGASDPRWNDSDLSQLANVGSENFDVVKMAPEFPGYDSATAPTGASPVIHSFTASSQSVASGSAVTFSYSVSGDSYDFIDAIGPVKAGGGSVTIHPTATQSYTLNSTNQYGRSTSEAITVTVTGSVVAAPVFAPPAGSYSTTQTVTLTTPTSANAVIHYTTNGTTPTVNSTVFTFGNPVKISSSETIKAIATATGYAAPSAVSSAAYTIASLAATPTFTPVAGAYNGAQTVSISTTTPAAMIFYTVDGSNPATSATAIKYTAPITVSKTETVDAVAEATGFTNSAEGSACYTINHPLAVTPTFTPAAGSYTGTQTVTIKTATAHATILYTTDGTNPTTSTTALTYTTPITVAKTETVNAFADEPGVTQNSTVATAAYIIIAPAAATPTFSPAAGSYTASQTVTIRTTTPNATIFYTTDGSNPATNTSAIKYTAPITVAKTETLKAVAEATGVTNSEAASAAYTITLPSAATPTFSPAAGSYTGTQTVTIKTTTLNATIFYTTNGTNPASIATVLKYTAPITVSSTETLNAVAEATGFTNSAEGSAAYTINHPPAATPTFTPVAGSYTGTQTVTIKTTTPNATILYTMDGTNPTISKTALIYSTPIVVSKTETLNAFADTPGTTTNSAVATAVYTIKASTVTSPKK